MTLLSLIVMLLPSALARGEVPPPNRLVDWLAPLEAETPGTRVGMIAEASGAARLAADRVRSLDWDLFIPVPEPRNG
jgi:hypothetical protein